MTEHGGFEVGLACSALADAHAYELERDHWREETLAAWEAGGRDNAARAADIACRYHELALSARAVAQLAYTVHAWEMCEHDA